VALPYYRILITEGVEPTNNHAERVLRRGVLWRKLSFGCTSAQGCRFVERILTAVQTLRQQQRDALQCQCDTVQAHRAGLPSPSLMPETG
jgi:transposase